MAQGDITIFEEAMKYMITGGWAGTDNVNLALITNATPPTAGFLTPALGDFTQIAIAGAYTGPVLLDTLDNMLTEVGGVLTFDDTGADVTWAQNGASPQDARWGLIYNATVAGNPAIGFIELDTVNVDMQAGPLTITWSTSPNAIFQIS